MPDILFSWSNRDEFLAKRTSAIGIGGSDIASVCGYGYKHPFEIYARIRQQLTGIKPVETKQNKNMAAGIILEKVVKEFYTIETGRAVTEVNACFCVPDSRHLFYSPDGLIGKDCLFEAKTSSTQNGFSPSWGYKDCPVIPKHYWAQCQYGMQILNLHQTVLAVLFDGVDLKWFLIHRDPDFDGLNTADKFFKNCLIQKEPEMLLTDYAAVDWAMVYPQPVDNCKKLNKQSVQDVKKLYKIKSKINELEKTEKILSGKLKYALSDNTVGIDGTDAELITWKPDKNGQRTLRLKYSPDFKLRGNK